jgi:endonuclease YncB( thermonuclease family)
MYEYRATLQGVHDGDTITVLLDQGLKEFRSMHIRLFGINAPELATAAGKPARDHLTALLGGTTGVALVIRTLKDKADKYGERWDGMVWLESDGSFNGVNAFVPTVPSINERMVRDGFALVYLP